MTTLLFLPSGDRGYHWVRFADGWKVVAAHVSIEGAGS